MSEKSEQDPDIYTSAELAALWRVTTRTVTNWYNRGEFPNAVKIGRGPNAIWRIPKADVRAFERRNNPNR